MYIDVVCCCVSLARVMIYDPLLVLTFDALWIDVLTVAYSIPDSTFMYPLETDHWKVCLSLKKENRKSTLVSWQEIMYSTATAASAKLNVIHSVITFWSWPSSSIRANLAQKLLQKRRSVNVSALGLKTVESPLAETKQKCRCADV